MAQQKYPAAKTLLAQAVALEPSNIQVQGSLALLDLTNGNIDGAADRYDSILAEAKEEHPNFVLGLAEARLRQSRPLDALKLIESALSLPDLIPRTRALFLQLQARSLVAASAGREDSTRCSETAPIVLAWLDAAELALQQAADTGVALPQLPAVKRLVRRRRGIVSDVCPIQEWPDPK